MKKSELILGIYTELEWHEHRKPKRKNVFPGCPLCHKAFPAEYKRWWRKKQELLNTKKLLNTK